MMWRRLSLSLVVCALVVGPAAAQERQDSAASAITGPAVAATPDMPHAPAAIDVDDLWHLLRHSGLAPDDGAGSRHRFFVLAPTVGSKPSTGFTGGLSGNVAFFAGEPATTHISTIIGGTKVSQLGQVLFGGRIAWFTTDDAWLLVADGKMSWTSQSTYALGTDAPLTSGTNSRLDVMKLYGTAYRNVAPGLFIGGGVNVSSHYNIRPGTTSPEGWNEAAFVAYNEANGFASTQQTSSGLNAGIRYDTRDNGINPDRGVLASATYRTFFAHFLGGDSTWQELSLDARTYWKLTSNGRQKLAVWFLGDLVTGGTAPFWDLPSTSMDGRSARGYGEGRYRGEQLLYWEAEYRASLTSNGLLGAVVFANLTTVGSAETGARLFESYAPAAGFGLRVLLNKRSRTNLCADWGWGKDGSRGFYLAIQEAF
jgi:hypothetical protein